MSMRDDFWALAHELINDAFADLRMTAEFTASSGWDPESQTSTPESQTSPPAPKSVPMIRLKANHSQLINNGGHALLGDYRLIGSAISFGGFNPEVDNTRLTFNGDSLLVVGKQVDPAGAAIILDVKRS